MLTAKEAKDITNNSELILLESKIRMCAIEGKSQYVHNGILSTHTISYLRELGYKVDVSVNAVRIMWSNE